MSTWRPPHRTLQGTGNKSHDITFLGLTNTTNNFDLANLIKIEKIRDPGGNLTVDWSTSTPILLVFVADPGDAWEVRIYGNEHEGVGKL